jgi:hypothetical protein
MLNRPKTCLALFVLAACAALASPAFAEESAPKTPVTTRGSQFQFGATFYPTSRYPAGTNTYLVCDKDSASADASVVLRDRGNARAEIGIIGDNDLHVKMVTGYYGSEAFTDRLLIRAETGEVDSFGTLLRQYAPSGRPAIVAGNSDLVNGAGLELIYDQDKKQGEISSVDHHNGYSSLLVRSGGVRFLRGAGSESEVASISNEGTITSRGVVSGGTKFTVSGCSAKETVGGAAAGRFKSGTAGACVAVVTLNGEKGMAAPNGWACSASNLTAAGNPVRQTASTPTTATFAGKTARNDVISFYCMGY